MRVASFIGQKGGVGKSALARVLAVSAARNRQKVLLADFDIEQLTSVEWAKTRAHAGHQPEIEARAFKTLKKLRKNISGYDLVVADTRGYADDLTEAVAEESDVVFLPTGTSMDDLRPTLGLARKLARHGINDKIVLVLSKVGRSERQLDDAIGLIEDSGFAPLEVAWPQRDGFQVEFDEGRSGGESSNPHLRQLAAWVEDALLARVLKS